MAFTVARSTTEILRLTRAQWVDGSPDIYGFLVDTSAAGTPPTEASSVATWLTYALGDPINAFDTPYISLTSGSFTYNGTSQRAETTVRTFDFTDYIANEFSTFPSTTLTHVVFADIFGTYVSTSQPPFAVLTETTPITLTSSTSLSYGVRLFGKAA